MRKIILTGGSGKLGKAIIALGLFEGIISPTHEELDISSKTSVRNFFEKCDFDTIIHCAAFTNLKEIEDKREEVIETNIVGTANLVMQTIIKEKESNKKIRFIHISSDAVYNRTEGNYSEKSPTIPFDKYGWSKLGAECSVNLLSDFCIIRTSFFEPEKLNFDKSPKDIYSSKLPINELVNAIKFLFESDFKGVINVGNKRISNYDLYKPYLLNLKPVKIDEIKDSLNVQLPPDYSMNISLWEKVKSG